MTCNKTALYPLLALCGSLALSGCLTTVPENGICGLSTLSGQYAFPVRAGLAFEDPKADKFVVWLWDLADAGFDDAGNPNDTSMIAEDWGSYCTQIALANYSSGLRPSQRTLVITLSPPLEGAHQGPPVTGVTAMSATYYEEGDMSGVAATTSTFNVTITQDCVTGPLNLTFPDAGAGSVLIGQISVPQCGPGIGGGPGGGDGGGDGG